MSCVKEMLHFNATLIGSFAHFYFGAVYNSVNPSLLKISWNLEAQGTKLHDMLLLCSLLLKLYMFLKFH
jgi:hypothetical protein